MKAARAKTAARMLALYHKRRKHHTAALVVVADGDGGLTVCSSITDRRALAALLRDATDTVSANPAALALVDENGAQVGETHPHPLAASKAIH